MKDSPFKWSSVPFAVLVLPFDTLDNEDMSSEVSAELFLLSEGGRTCSSNIRGTLVTPKSLVFCCGVSVPAFLEAALGGM